MKLDLGLQFQEDFIIDTPSWYELDIKFCQDLQDMITTPLAERIPLHINILGFTR
jgi:hypothetical protein